MRRKDIRFLMRLAMWCISLFNERASAPHPREG